MWDEQYTNQFQGQKVKGQDHKVTWRDVHKHIKYIA